LSAQMRLIFWTLLGLSTLGCRSLAPYVSRGSFQRLILSSSPGSASPSPFFFPVGMIFPPPYASFISDRTPLRRRSLLTSQSDPVPPLAVPCLCTDGRSWPPADAHSPNGKDLLSLSFGSDVLFRSSLNGLLPPARAPFFPSPAHQVGSDGPPRGVSIPARAPLELPTWSKGLWAFPHFPPLYGSPSENLLPVPH